MNTVFIAIISMTAIGLICSILLAVASKVMHVEVDERMALIRNCLPGANCGACGYSGCNGYATAIVEDDVAANLCPPGGNEVVTQISEIMGLGAGAGVTRSVAVVHCIGNNETKSDKMEYMGMTTCVAAKLHFGGQNACSFGCMGFGDCVKACPSDAVCIEKGLARVDMRKCTGCGLCAGACPSKVISITPAPVYTSVMCKNNEKGGVLKDKCKVGCIGCMKCVKECPSEALTLKDNLAVNDFSKCTGCLACVEVCPKSCIVSFSEVSTM